MRGALVGAVVVVVVLAAFAFSVFRGPVDGGRHWAAAPLLALSIVVSMGGLVALASGRRGSLK